LGKPQPQGARLPAPRINPPNVAKAMQSRMTFPDRLSAYDADASGQPWCPSSGVPGRSARSLSPALSLRQPRSAVERADRDGRGHDGGASKCATCCFACRFQRRAGSRPALRWGWWYLTLYQLPAGTCVSRCTCDHAAHRRASARDGDNGPGFVRTGTGYTTSLTALQIRLGGIKHACMRLIEAPRGSRLLLVASEGGEL
jgi:hypothetical protein